MLPPKPQQQTRFYARGGRCFGADPSKSYKEQIQWQIRPSSPAHPLEGPIQLDISFFIPIPSNTSKKSKTQMINGMILPVKRPDIDNLAYIVTNAMKSIVYADDSQIVDMSLHKRYGEIPKTVIKVIEIQP